MKRLVSVLCAAAMTCSIASSVMAAPSISSVQPMNPYVSGIVLPAGSNVVITDANPEGYESEAAKKGVEYINSGSRSMTMEGFLMACGLDPEGDFETTDGDEFNPNDYTFISVFRDLALDQKGEITFDYAFDKEMTVTFTADTAKNSKLEDLLICQIDAEDEDVFWIPADEYDPKEGKITADFPCFGPIAICEKVA